MWTPSGYSRTLVMTQIQNLRASALARVDKCNTVKAERSYKPAEVKPTGTDKEGLPFKRASAAMAKAAVHFGSGHQKGLAHLIAAIAGVEVADIYTGPETDTGTYPRFVDEPADKCMAIVMIANVNGHDYGLNRVAFLDGTRQGHCWQFSDEGVFGKGNHAPLFERGRVYQDTWRPATAEEINAECDRAMALARAATVKPETAGIGF